MIPKIRKVKLKALKNYEGRIIKGATYAGTYELGLSQLETSISFRCSLGQDTRVSYRSCIDGTWFDIIREGLDKNIKVI